MTKARILSLTGLLALSFSWPAALQARPLGRLGSSEPRRYVSSLAYYHAMRAEVLAARGDRAGAAGALQLALVYDPHSHYLNVQLAEITLEDGGPRADRLIEKALRLAPRRAAGWRLRARALRKKGDLRSAMRVLRKAIAVEPKSEAAVLATVELAEISFFRGDVAGAQRVLERAVARAEDPFDALIGLIELRSFRGRHKSLTSALFAAEAAAGDDPSRLAEVARWSERVGRPVQAARVWLRMVEAFNERADVLLSALEGLTRLGRDEEAERIFSRLVERDTDGVLRYQLGLIALEAGRTQRASEELAAAQSRMLDRDALRLARARVAQAESDASATLRHLEAIAKDSPHAPAATLLRVHALASLGQLRRAAAVAAESQPGTSGSAVLEADMLGRLGEHAEAVEKLEDAWSRQRSLDPALAEPLVIALDRAGLRPRAIALLGQLKEAHRELEPEADFLEAQLIAVTSPTRALQLTSKVLWRRPHHLGALLLASRLHETRPHGSGRSDRAARLATLAFWAHPDHPDVLVRLARLELAAKKTARALRHLKRARWFAPEDVDVLLALREAYAAAGRVQESQDMAARAIEQLRIDARARVPGALEALEALEEK